MPVSDPVGSPLDKALHRLMAEFHDGLRHGYFDISVTCEVIGQDSRRVTIRAGKTYQFKIPESECVTDPNRRKDS
jgi:hypothetical protein